MLLHFNFILIKMENVFRNSFLNILEILFSTNDYYYRDFIKFNSNYVLINLVSLNIKWNFKNYNYYANLLIIFHKHYYHVIQI